MSEIQKARDAVKNIEGDFVVLSKKAMAFWHMVSSVVGAVVGLFIHKYFNS